MKLRNAKDETITTVAGILFLAVGLFLLIADVYKDNYEIDWKILLGVGILGLGLILAPDDLYGVFRKKVDKL